MQGSNRSDMFATGRQHPAGKQSKALLRCPPHRKSTAPPAEKLSRSNSDRPKQVGSIRKSIL